MIEAFVNSSEQHACLLQPIQEAYNQEKITPQTLLLTVQELVSEASALDKFKRFGMILGTYGQILC